MIKTSQEMKNLESEKKLILHKGIYLEINPLTGNWFILANVNDDLKKDCTVYGTLAEMKKCAKFAAKNNIITQENYYTQIL